MDALLGFELSSVQILDNISVLDLKRLDSRLSLLHFNLFLVSGLADLPMSVVVVALPMCCLYRKCPALLE